MRKVIKAALIVVLALVVLVGGFLGWLTVTEFRPENTLEESVTSQGDASPLSGDTLSIATWNIGYCGLGARESFVLDGGEGSGTPENENVTLSYYSGVVETLGKLNADVCVLQEVDADSSRSYELNEAASLQGDLGAPVSAYALNYSCRFVPYPWPPIGKVNSGVLTMSDYTVKRAERIALPCPFSWPLRVANLKRCLLISRIPLEDSDNELVVVNLHLEAYDDGAGKAAQTAMLLQILEDEYAAGNYVIAGGDFNQAMPGVLDAYPVISPELWVPSVLNDADLPEGWRFAYDSSVPTCRLLNKPYDPDDPSMQYYVLDGFILSPNIELLSVETVDAGFAYSDHNPVRIEVKLS